MTADEAVSVLKSVEKLLSAKVLEAEPMCDEVPVLLGAVRAVLKQYAIEVDLISDTSVMNALPNAREMSEYREIGSKFQVIALAQELEVLLTKGE